MRSVIAGLTTAVLLVALPAPSPAQGPATGPEDQRMTRMMQMGQMHERMRGMMQEQHADTQKMCPGMAAPDSTKKGG